jgi:small subunit ribosomal protein S20
MPSHASPKKRIRRDLKKTCSNQSRKSALKTLSKKVLAKDISAEERAALMRRVQKALDKAASRGVIHRKNASRRVGRLAAACASL